MYIISHKTQKNKPMSQLQLQYKDQLIDVASKLVANGKGILAADESVGTIGKHFASIGVENTVENRGLWRQILFSSDHQWEKYISGVILYEEQLFQKVDNDRNLIDYLVERDVLIGIKVDKGVRPIFGTDGETLTEGIDGLGDRCKKYYDRGARFAKWRAVIKISKSAPTENAIIQNAYTLARYAIICQENGLVPIIEPEILADGDHDIDTCFDITKRVLSAVYYACSMQNVLLAGTLLKTSMVIPGFGNHFSNHSSNKNGIDGINAKIIAQYTVDALMSTVPPAVPGIVFLSGGQSELDATINLAECNKICPNLPWRLSFSYGRALQKSALTAWSGNNANIKLAQDAWVERAKDNYLASIGQYHNHNNNQSGQSNSKNLHIENYIY